MILLAGTVLAVLFAAVCLAPSRARPWIWIAVIGIAVVPWLDVQTHAHWRRVGWIPFLSPPVRMRDIALNTVMYMPFGIFFHGPGRRRSTWHLLIVMAAACGLSVATEASQSYSHSRFPSATDVAANVWGAVLGWFVAAARRRRRDIDRATPTVGDTSDDSIGRRPL